VGTVGVDVEATGVPHDGPTSFLSGRIPSASRVRRGDRFGEALSRGAQAITDFEPGGFGQLAADAQFDTVPRRGDDCVSRSTDLIQGQLATAPIGRVAAEGEDVPPDARGGETDLDRTLSDWRDGR
jgi:hypothetical protein